MDEPDPFFIPSEEQLQPNKGPLLLRLRRDRLERLSAAQQAVVDSCQVMTGKTKPIAYEGQALNAHLAVRAIIEEKP